MSTSQDVSMSNYSSASAASSGTSVVGTSVKLTFYFLLASLSRVECVQAIVNPLPFCGELFLNCLVVKY